MEAAQRTTQVLIVGGGPTGLMLANQLARRGVAYELVDRLAQPALQTRALGVQARTLEIYAKLGIAAGALELGSPFVAANVHANGRRLARIPLGEIGTGLSPFPFVLVLGQEDNERILRERLATQGGAVRWRTELQGLAPEDDAVLATLQREGGARETVRARWVAGCDGAHSAVRRLCGIDFPGAPYEEFFFLADARVRGPMVPRELNAYLWKNGFHLFFPLRGADHWRVIGIVPRALRAREKIELGDVAPVLAEQLGRGLEFVSCSWFTTYRIHHRRAQRFRAGRCFLLGDAAHIHSPVGAQGMNTGLQDAYNLAWKLALVVQGRARESLLESYEAERVPFAERLLRTTDRAFSILVSESWWSGLLRSRLLARAIALAMRFRRPRRLAFLTVSQIGVRYPKSPLSRASGELPRSAPRAGDRFPWMRLELAPGAAPSSLFERLDDRSFALLLFGGTAPELPADLRELIDVVEIPASDANARELARCGVPLASAFLLRPDGHVGCAWKRAGAAAIERYFVECVGSAGVAAIPRSAARAL